ncbi:hypothetical protein KXS15_24465 [Sinorhizobium meliloti]|uniref:hypothetical protein n=1 Tax=Rhizobium meliloti TaxID=382 RepID=UPI003F174DAF
MRNAFLNLGAASIAAIQVATAQPALAAEPGNLAVTEESLPPAEPAGGGREDSGLPGPDQMRRGPGPTGMPPEVVLAARLAVLETRIGIRSEQINVWRDYTSALQTLLSMPRPRHGDPGKGGAEAAPGRAPQADLKNTRDPFALEEAFADDFVKRAVAAQRLKAAIAALRTTLTPEQLDILASTDRLGGRLTQGGGGPSEEAAGPGGAPHDEWPRPHLPPGARRP